MPPNSERIVIGGETAWIWETQCHRPPLHCVGWSVLQGPYRIDLENVEKEGQTSHTIDWTNRVPRNAEFEGGLARRGPGHLDRATFLEEAERIILTLRRKDAPPSPPKPARSDF